MDGGWRIDKQWFVVLTEAQRRGAASRRNNASLPIAFVVSSQLAIYQEVL